MEGTLSLFGPVRLLDALGREVTVPGRKARALLAYLALEPRPHRRGALMGLLWPEMPDADARNNLRVTVARLRRALKQAGLDGDALQSDRHTVALAADALAIDRLRFARLLDEVAGHPHDDRAGCDACLERRVEAATLAGGELLEGLDLAGCEAFERWRANARQRLSDELAALLTDLAHDHLARRRPEEAQRFLRLRLDLDPLDEAAHRELMRLLALQGQRNGALEHFRDFAATLEHELGVAPEGATTDLYRRIEGGDVAPEPITPAEPPRPSHNLPEDATPFVGRVEELARLEELVHDHRLVTLLGPGGSGKTRLAIAAARRLLDAFPDGVFLVRLAPLRAAADLVAALAEAIGYTFEPGRDPTGQLIAHLKPQRLLLVMDNFEHLPDGADLVAALLDATPDVRVLVTSRQRLHLRGEAPSPLPGLGYADPAEGAAAATDARPDDALSLEAVRLFVESAQRVRRDLRLDGANLAAIRRICRLVEGMPLGIVLAASWIDTLSPSEIASELQQDLDLLETDLRDVPERQRSVRAAFEHSWRLLTPEEQRTFATLSAFRGGFDREAAQAVAGASLRRLTTLVHKSLIQPQPDLGRYDTHELTRQFAEEKLAASGELERVLDAHARHYLERLAGHEAALGANPDAALLAELERDVDNLRAAWLRAAKRRDLALLAAALPSLRLLLSVRNRFQDAIALFGAALDELRSAPTDSPVDTTERDRLELALVVAPLFAMRALLGFAAPELKRALDRALELSERLDDTDRLPVALYGLFSYHYSAAEHRTALPYAQRLLALGERERDAPILVVAHLLNLAVHTLMGDLETASEHYRRNQEIYRPEHHHQLAHRYGFDFGVMAPAYGAMIAWLRGRPDRAVAISDEGIAVGRARGHPLSLSHVWTFTTFVFGWCGDLDRFERYAADALDFARRHHFRGYIGIATITHCWARGLRGDRASLDEMRDGFELMANSLNLRSMILVEAARVHLRLGDLEGADRYLAQAEAHIASSDERIVEAEVKRLRGDVLLALDPEGSAASSEACFRQALALAERQGARSLALRAAISLARLERDRGEPGEAFATLRRVYDGFEEGFGTADLVEARGLLERSDAEPAA